MILDNPASIPPPLLRRRRRTALLGLLAVTPLGFLLKYGTLGPLTQWGHVHGAGAAYVAFWIFLVVIVFPRLHPAVAAGMVLAVVSALECLQAVHISWLDGIRRTMVGAWLLGADFDWSDFPWYAVGAMTAWGLFLLISRPDPDAGTPS